MIWYMLSIILMQANYFSNRIISQFDIMFLSNVMELSLYYIEIVRTTVFTNVRRMKLAINVSDIMPSILFVFSK